MILAGSVGQIIGTGQGRGIGLLYLFLGILTLLATAAGYSYRPLRRIEADLPDTIVEGDEAGAEAPSGVEPGQLAPDGLEP